MKTDTELAQEIEIYIRTYVPKWKTIDKGDSVFHKTIGIALTIITLGFLKYMISFWTTIGYTAAHPTGDEDAWRTQGHEGKHGIQALKWTRPVFFFLYLFPQSLLTFVAVALAIIFSPWFWFGLLSMFLPLPAPWRAWWELQAYSISVMLWEWSEGHDTDIMIEYIAKKQFTGPNYLCMWPFKWMIVKRLKAAQKLAQSWEAEKNKDPYINGLYNILKEGGRLK